MQIVRDLGGYTLGRSDLVRRAMSKKKQSVMEKERANFIYGNQEEEVPGCQAKGIDEQTAGSIFDDMMDFAKYAFNKSHAACYAVVAYQTAYLKYYYPVEFMAALMTSVIDNSGKVSEYILLCRSMGIELLPPDVNEGESGFSVSGKSIRYALTAIRGVGRPVIECLVEERVARGPFTNLKDLITRTADKDLNKRVIENFIKAGALDGLGGTRKQFMSVYVQILEHITKDKKSNLAGQLSLFDIADESQKEEFDIRMPDVGEYTKEMLLAFEKEVLGIYLSGHPLEQYEELWRKHITNTTGDFQLDEETGTVTVEERSGVVLGGMVADKTIKYTRNDKVMAFLNLEDLIGNVEVVVFPKDYEKYSAILQEDAKLFICGRASVEEDKDAKLICEQIVTFEEAVQAADQPLFQTRSWGSWAGGRQGFGGSRARNERAMNDNVNNNNENNNSVNKMPNGIWIQFPTPESYKAREQELLAAIADSDGNDNVVIFVKDPRSIKILPANLRVRADEALSEKLMGIFGQENVKIR